MEPGLSMRVSTRRADPVPAVNTLPAPFARDRRQLIRRAGDRMSGFGFKLQDTARFVRDFLHGVG
jgi:hypothetical protein